jgi:competence protein ComEA
MSRRRVVLLALVVALAGCGLFGRGSGDDFEEPPRPAPIDLNKASLRKIEGLPGVTPSMAKRIVENRPYTDVRELVDKGVLNEREADRIRDHVEIPNAR